MNPQAEEIGKVLEQARIQAGYRSRSSLTRLKRVRDKLTSEGLRKIERGERVPKLENLRMLAEVLGLDKKRTRELERLALEKNVERVVRRAGNVKAQVKIEGKPVRVAALPPKRKVEKFVREVTQELTEMVYKYGVLDQDVEHFRKFARHVLYKHL